MKIYQGNPLPAVPNRAPRSSLGEFGIVPPALAPVFAGAGAYHGYKRTGGSVGWAVGYAALAALFPLITGGVMLAQGFGKRK